MKSHTPGIQAPRPPGPQDLSGVLIVDKPPGPTSHDVVTLARRALGVSRIGHTGTLDPMATGVLPLVVGRATRLAQFLTASDKRYEATIAFGRATDTYDAVGKVVSTHDARPARAGLDAALDRFRGTFEQTPPVYSAKNIDGERSYELARKAARSAIARSATADGPAIALTRPKPVRVTAHRVDVLSFDGETAVLDLAVTAGFYVRSLAHDLGEALGCGAHLAALRRTRSGEFGLDLAVPLADVLQLPRDALAARLVSVRDLLPDLPSVRLRSARELERLKNGVEMAPSDLVAPLAMAPEAPGVIAPQVIVRLLGPEGDLVGLAKPGKTPGFLHGWVVLG